MNQPTVSTAILRKQDGWRVMAPHPLGYRRALPSEAAPMISL